MTVASNILEAPARGIRRWVMAASLVVALHVGGVALALHDWPEEEAADFPSGVISIELSPMTAVADQPADDAPLGPRTEEVAPKVATPAPPKVAEEHHEETPVAEKSPVSEPPVAVPEPVKKADEKPVTEKATPQPANPVEAAAAQQAAAPPKFESAPARASSASKQGRTTKPSKAQLTWQKALVLQLDRFKRYPSAARLKRVQGVTTVEFVIDRQGNVTSSRVAKSSGSDVLDAASLGVLARASPLPRPPGDIAAGRIELSLPIQFQFRD